MRMPVLETERCSIRPFTVADFDACNRLSQAVFDSPVRADWMRWAIGAPDELAQLNQPPYGDRSLVLKETNELIGQVGLVPAFGPFATLSGLSDGVDEVAAMRRNSPEFGLFWALLPDYRGHGYATEAGRALIEFAFDALQVRRVVATTERDNAASLAVMRRLGMQVLENPNPEPFWFQMVGVLENKG